MILVWAVPAAFGLIGLVVVGALAQRAAQEAAGLRRDVSRFAELQPVLSEVRDLSRSLRRPAR
ncbi:MAG: hypothetical protein NVS3B21_03990 [Acidimicrobiales bacterium]